MISARRASCEGVALLVYYVWFGAELSAALLPSQGRQRKRWEDNIREWTGLEFAKSQRAVENREKWRNPVAKSSVVPPPPDPRG